MAHLLYGPLLIALHAWGLPLHGFLGLVLGGLLISFWIKHQQEKSILGRLLLFFERLHHFKSFPGRGPIFFTLGASLCFLLFPPPLAYASLMILSVGDSVSHLIGRQFGKVKTPLHPEKYIEGSIVAFLLSVPFAFLFFPHLLTVILASLAAMLVELPTLRLGPWRVDDNLLIPLVAGSVMWGMSLI